MQGDPGKRSKRERAGLASAEMMRMFEVGVGEGDRGGGEEVMKHPRLGVLLAFCASVGLGFAVAATGCGDSSYNPGPENGGSTKAPEMTMAPQQPGPRGASASSMSQSLPTPSHVVTAPCGAGLACTGMLGCQDVCSAPHTLFTSCNRCENGVFAACTQAECLVPPPEE
jgi:hypothetical protein